MTYSDTPLATQRIFQTQPLIRTNFQMVKDALQEDHSFAGNIPGQEEGTHNKVSLKSIATPTALPAGCDAITYLDTDKALRLFKGPGIQPNNLSVYSISCAVNFDGTGANNTDQAIRSSYNCASAHKTGTGRYTINFLNPLTYNDYIVQITCARASGGGIAIGSVAEGTYSVSCTTTHVLIETFGSSSHEDCMYVGVIVFGGQ